MNKSHFGKILSFALIAMLALMGACSKTEEKKTVTVFWAEYDGDTPEYTANLEKAFEKEYPNIDLKIDRVNWNNLKQRLTTYIAGGKEPDLSVIGTRWLLSFHADGVVEPIEQHLPKNLLDNIDPAAMEGRIDGKLLGLPMAMGTRMLYYRPDLVGDKAPETFEEMLTMAKKVHNPPSLFGVGVIGKKYVENTDLAYYLYGNGGDYFHTDNNGNPGKAAMNSPEAVQALSFINDLVNKYKVSQPGVGAYGRDELQNLFLAGKLGFFMAGGNTASLLKKNNVPFKWAVAPIPYFSGKKRSSLLVTDAMVMFKKSKNKKEAAKFLEFFYRDEWRLQFDKNTGFPPVTKSLGSHEAFKSAVHQTMIASVNGAKGWPLVEEWPEVNDILWTHIEKVLQQQAKPEEAMNKAVVEINAKRKK